MNWRRKRRMFQRSTITLGAPSQWLLDRSAESPLVARFSRFLIHNGVDLEIFYPGDRSEARRCLGLPDDEPILLFLANKGTKSRFKDFYCLAQALRKLSDSDVQVRLVTVGGEPTKEVREALPSSVIFVPYIDDRDTVGDYYRAADLFCHATLADVCPLTVLESQACGTPVVASRVGGVPEIVQNGQTGLLVPQGDAGQFAKAITDLLNQPDRLRRMGRAAVKHATDSFSLSDQADKFIKMFRMTLKGPESE